jgi:hypothetical protein
MIFYFVIGSLFFFGIIPFLYKVFLRIIWKPSIHNFNFNFCDDGGLLNGEIDKNVISTNKNADILIIMTEKFSKINYGIANRIEYIIDEEILGIKKMFRVRV